MTTLELSNKIEELQRVYFNFNTTDEECLIVADEIIELKEKRTRLYVESGQIKSLVKSPYGNGRYTTSVGG